MYVRQTLSDAAQGSAVTHAGALAAVHVGASAAVQAAAAAAAKTRPIGLLRTRISLPMDGAHGNAEDTP